LRLFVNGYVIEVTDWSRWFSKSELNFLREYKQTTLAQESIKALTPESLFQLQQQGDIETSSKLFLQRLHPYTSDLIKLFFNEPINRESAKNSLVKVSQDYKLGKRGIGSRPKTVDIDELLASRGINTSKYSKEEVKHLPQDRMGVYIKSFTVDSKTPRQYWLDSNDRKIPVYNFANGILNEQEIETASVKFHKVYLLAGVDKKAWLLFEEYLKDFAKPAMKLNNGEGYVEKFYISARKYIVPAKVNIKLENIGYSVWIPFGFSEEFPTFETATREIRRRLENSGLPTLKVAFKRETIAQ
jgi:hypothetical protein